jgi:hypothetical protein
MMRDPGRAFGGEGPRAVGEASSLTCERKGELASSLSLLFSVLSPAGRDCGVGVELTERDWASYVSWRTAVDGVEKLRAALGVGDSGAAILICNVPNSAFVSSNLPLIKQL